MMLQITLLYIVYILYINRGLYFTSPPPFLGEQINLCAPKMDTFVLFAVCALGHVCSFKKRVNK